jgi:hypothetical protein
LFPDVAAGFIGASSFMLKTPDIAADEAAMRYVQNIALFRSSIFQRAEAWCGDILFATGSILQLIGSYQNASDPIGPRLLNSVPRLAVAAIESRDAPIPADSACNRQDKPRSC